MSKKETLQEVIDQLNKKYSQDTNPRFFAKTGSIQLDKALGGGLSSGRITELIAWEGCGKSTLALHITAEAHKMGLNVSYIDAEHAIDETYARAIGVDWDKFKTLLRQPSTGEEAFDSGIALMNTGELDVLIFDSTAGMIPKKQLEDPAGSSHLGLHARLFSSEMPKVNAIASKNNVVVIFISQVREKIGVMFGSPETTQAGNALKFFASNRIELRRSLNKEGSEVIDQTTKFKVLKCKTGSPFSTGEFNIRFGTGIDKVGDLIAAAISEGIITKAGSWYSHGETKIGQGVDSVRAFLQDNEEFAEQIKQQITI